MSPRYWYRGPWRWVEEELESYWDRPLGTIGVLDVRSIPQAATPGGSPGLGIFVTEAPLADSNYELLGVGHWTEIKRSQRLVDLLPCRSGFVPSGDDLRGLIFSAFTDGGDPHGDEWTKPVVPGPTAQYDLLIAGLRVRQPFAPLEGHWAKVQAVLRASISLYWSEVDAGRMQADTVRKVLGAWCEQYGLLGRDDWRLLVEPSIRSAIGGPLPHETEYQDLFDRGNSPGLGGGWSNMVQSGFDVENQQARGTSATQLATRARFLTDVSSADMWARLRIISYGNVSGASMAAIARVDSSADTGYMFSVRTGTAPRRRQQRLQGGTASTIASDDVAPPSVNSTVRTQVVGGIVQAFVDDVEITGLAASDSNITTGLKGGMSGIQSTTTAARSIFDDFTIADVSSPVTASFTCGFESTAYVLRSLAAGYESLQRVSQSRSAGYESLGICRASHAAAYESLARIAASHTSSWENLLQVTQQLQASWEALRAVSASHPVAWESAGTIPRPDVCFDLPYRPTMFDLPYRPTTFDLRKR